FEAVIPLSAATGDGIGILKQELFDMAEPSPHYFPDDTLTDQPERVLAAEIIRESTLRLLSEEVPHGIAIDIEAMTDRTTGNNEEIIDLMATIYCEKSSHKGIIIGKKGDMLKRIGQGARIELERVFGVKFNLTLWVKVREGWRNSERNLRNFGFVPRDE
ncbi:MAG: GTPase Era, partial [Ruminococcaceae bacterium]|nr:GTPase Era [Oscillospiraceae bacterium]